MLPSKQYYKVLVPRILTKNSNGLTGGFTHFDYTKYLPVGSQPGKWLPQRRALELCVSGWHVTPRPVRWNTSYGRTRRVFLIEMKGPTRRDTFHINSPKTTCQQIRLVKEIKRGSAAWKRIMTQKYQNG